MSPTPTAELVKYEGLGNDFLILLDPSAPGPAGAAPVASERQRAALLCGYPFAQRGPGTELAVAVCDRHRGFGADGLIAAHPGPPGIDVALVFRLWNANGSEAEMSGNGVRCLAHAALDAGLVEAGVPFAVATPAGRREVTVSSGSDDAAAWARVDMGKAVVGGVSERGNVGEGRIHVDMGNPHLVVLGPDPAGVDVAGIGARLDAAEPGGLNVGFAALGPGPDEVTLRVWERGVGETLACGTGSCAAAAAFHHWGRVGPAVTVHQRGGAMAVEVGEDSRVLLSGPSRRIGRCSLP